MKIVDSTEAPEGVKSNPGNKKTNSPGPNLNTSEVKDDYSRFEDNVHALKPLRDSQWSKLEFLETSVDFALFFDPALTSKFDPVTLYPWQVEVPEEICKAKASSLHPYKYCLCAANGSGKDAFVIAPFALWFICCKVRSRIIITSSSGVQLTNQTEAYLSGLAQKVNAWAEENLGCSILKVKRRHIICLLSGSEIILFATDEEGKAEGYHPIEPGREMAILVNEAKSVKPEIFRALRRCTGFNYFILVSTPGEPIGEFYKAFEYWPNKRRVTYYDCPRHQSPDEFESDKKELGEHDPLFRSKWLALFTFIGGKNVINQMALERLRSKINKNLIKWIKQDEEERVGLDISLSSHGDETVIVILKGNKQIHLTVLRNKDATVLADNIDRDLIKAGIKKTNKYISADDGGVGRAVIDILVKKGWTVNRVLNQSPAKNKKRYRNRGAELWDGKMNRIVEGQAIILLDDDKLYSQIASRKYLETEAGIDRLTLESKVAMKSEGLPSPDRADALVLALSTVNVVEYCDLINQVSEDKPKAKVLSSEEQLAYLENLMWEDGSKSKVKRHSGFSLNVIMNRNKNVHKLLSYGNRN